jgi:hypothetical protein
MTSFVYQDVIYLICVMPSGEVQVGIWMLRCGNVVLLTVTFFEVAKFTTLTPLSLLVSCWLSLPIIGLKMSALPTFALKSPTKIFVCYQYLKIWCNSFFICFRVWHSYVSHPALYTSWDSSVSIATRLQTVRPGFDSRQGAGKIFSFTARTDRHWGPPSFLLSEYRGFCLRDKTAGAWSWPLTSI